MLDRTASLCPYGTALNQDKVEEDDLLKDFIAIITSFCCRLYGARRGQSKALSMKEELKT